MEKVIGPSKISEPYKFRWPLGYEIQAAIDLCIWDGERVLNNKELTEGFPMKRLLTICLVLMASSLHAQDATLDLTGEEPAPPKSTPAITITSDVTAVFCIICDSEPTKFIVLDQKGQWVPDVHSASFTFEPNKTAEITCTIWVGPYQPSKPSKKTWKLEQMMTVSKDEFTTYVDELQADPRAIAKKLGE